MAELKQLDPYLWAIRHKPTGFYLLHRNNTRGSTLEEPGLWGSKRFPRLFNQLPTARKALAAWLQGRWVRRFSQDHNGEYDESITIKPVSTRVSEEMEIVKFNLTEIRE